MTTDTDTETTTEAREDVRLTADVVALADVAGQRHVLLIERGWPPYAGMWALPGGHVDPGEDVADAARRELAEETGLRSDVLALVQVGPYSAPGRDPRGRYVSIAYVTVLDTAVPPAAGDDAADARWVPVRQALAEGLAFDHAQILTDALAVVLAGEDSRTAAAPLAATTEALSAIGLLQAAAAGYRTRGQAAYNAPLTADNQREAARLGELAAGLERQARVLEDTLLADLTATGR